MFIIISSAISAIFLLSGVISFDTFLIVGAILIGSASICHEIREKD